MADNTLDALSILTGLLSTAYKMDHGKIAELLEAEDATTDSVKTALLAEDALRVSNLKKQNADNKDSFNQGYAKAKQLERVAFEKEIKDALEVDSENTGVELINEIITAKAPAGAKAAELTDDDIKKHSAFQTMERNFKKQLTDVNAAKTAELEALKKTYKENEIFSSVREQADVILQGLNPILSKNANVANTIKNQFFNELKGYGYEQQENGTFLPTKDGKVLADGHGHTKGFDDLIKETAANFFDFNANNGGGNAGNQNQNPAGGGAGAAKSFKSEEEASNYANDASVPLADRLAALEAYNKSPAV